MATILILEDETGWNDVVTAAIRNGSLPDCSVHIAQTYGQAASLIEQHGFDIALLDYALQRSSPESDGAGLDVARKLRSVSPVALVLLVSKVAPDNLRAECERLGVTLIEKGRRDLVDELLRQIRNRLQLDQKTLNSQWLPEEDTNLPGAFADIVSKKVMAEYSVLRKELQELRLAHAVLGVQHDVKSVLWLPRFFEGVEGMRDSISAQLERLRTMFDRSCTAARVVSNSYVFSRRATCDVAGVLREFFPPQAPGEVQYLSPLMECRANVLLRTAGISDEPLEVQCDKKLIELAILVLPVLVYHLTDIRLTDDHRPIEAIISCAGTRTRRMQMTIVVAASTTSLSNKSKECDLASHYVHYTNLLCGPVIPWEAFVKAFKYYGAAVSFKRLDRATYIEIELEAASGKEKSGAPL